MKVWLVLTLMEWCKAVLFIRRATYQDYTRVDSNQHWSTSFETFQPFVNFLLEHTFIAILDYRSSPNMTNTHTYWPQNSNHRSLPFGAFSHCTNHVKLIAVLSLPQKITSWSDEGSYGYLIFMDTCIVIWLSRNNQQDAALH
jgi:hypothetical protein